MLLVFLVLVASVCGEVAYGQLVYAVRRPPVRRAASAIEALERLRLAPPPIASYFPQVDSEAAGYPVEGDLYALPPQWTEEFGQPVQEEPEYGFYEYEPYSVPIYRPQPPAYAEEVYPQDPESAEYSDLMESYLMGSGPLQQQQQQQQQTFENVQRRSEEPPRPSSAPAAHSKSTPAPPPTATPITQVQMTAVPASPEKKRKQSAVLPDPEPAPVSAPGSGQKEEPLFRPLQSSQRTSWSEGPPLPRAKNAAPRKTPIPLLKQMIQKGRQQEQEDPLMRELSSLKKSL